MISMGAVYIEIEVGDMRGELFEPVEVMVDTGATFTTVPAQVLNRLGVSPQRTMPVRLADGTVIDDEICDTMIRFGRTDFFHAGVFRTGR